MTSDSKEDELEGRKGERRCSQSGRGTRLPKRPEEVEGGVKGSIHKRGLFRERVDKV